MARSRTKCHRPAALCDNRNLNHRHRRSAQVLENGFATSPTQVTNTFAVNPYYKLGYAQTWNFTIQNTLPHGLVIEAEYIGTKGTDLAINEQPDRAVPGSPISTQTLQIANATGFTYQTAGANSIFNAAQTRITRRFTRGISATALYTFFEVHRRCVQLHRNGRHAGPIHRRPAPRARTFLLLISGTTCKPRTFLFSSPVGIHGMLRNGGWKTAALAGWTLSGTFSATSGDTPDGLRGGQPLEHRRLSRVRNQPSRSDRTTYPKRKLFLLQSSRFHHTAPRPIRRRGSRYDPRSLPTGSHNSSLNRAFRFGDSRRQIQLRISATNALNHVTITSIGTTVNSQTYGLPTAASGTRNVSVMLRYNF